MKHLRVLLFLAFVAGAYGQSTSTIRGIKILSSVFDPQSRIVNLTFINDTPLNITAWGYCVNAQNSPGHTVSHGYCTFVDPLVTVIDHRIESVKRPSLPEPGCPICRLIHPGEQKTLTGNLTSFPEVIGAAIEVNLIVYGDGTVESLRSAAAQSALETIRTGRIGSLAIKQALLKLASQVLRDPNDSHPAQTMIHALELRAPSEPGLAEPLEKFKRPGWHQGDEHEYLLENEKEYLKQYVAELNVWIDQYSKNQIKGGVQ